jgi:nitrogenase-associated protein
MANVIFYEKPGCAGNARQKELLRAAGHTLEVRDLLAHLWTPEELRLFFRDLPVADWFNRTSPRVKSGEIVPERLGRDEAMTFLLADPVLIRRPLMQVGNEREVGFLSAVVEAWIGLEPAEPASCSGLLEGCGSTAGAPCTTHEGPKPVQLGTRRP